MGTASLVLGIIGLVLTALSAATFLMPLFSVPALILGVLAAVFGVLGTSAAQRTGVGASASKAGSILGGVTVLLLLLMFFVTMIVLVSA